MKPGIIHCGFQKFEPIIMNFHVYAVEKIFLDITFASYMLYLLHTGIKTYLVASIWIYLTLHIGIFFLLILSFCNPWTSQTGLIYSTLRIASGCNSIFTLSHSSLYYSIQGIFFCIYAVNDLLKMCTMCCMHHKIVDSDNVELDTFVQMEP